MNNVYKIVNLINGKVYVGRTIHSLEARWDGHMKCLNRGDSRHLYCAMRQYGVENFSIELLESCDSFDEMVAKEAYYCEKLQAYTNGYNMTTAGEINPMECVKSRISHDDKMRSDDVRLKISASMVEVRKQSQNHVYIHKGKAQKRVPPTLVDQYINQGWEIGTIKGKIRMHNLEGKETTVFVDEVPTYESNGWIIGGKPGRLSKEHLDKLSASHGPRSEEYKKAQSDRLVEYYRNNPNYKSKSKRNIQIEDPVSHEIINFDSCKAACIYMEMPVTLAEYGAFSRWIKSGYISRKGSKYHKWLIRDIK